MTALLSEYRAQNYIPVPESGCWLWLGSVSKEGYPKCSSPRTIAIHRLFYRHFKGYIPPGMSVCHKCDTRLCVNPDHLFLGTHTDNMRDAGGKGRLAFRSKTTLKRISLEDALAIHARTDSSRTLAREYGVSRKTISNAKERAERYLSHTRSDGGS